MIKLGLSGNNAIEFDLPTLRDTRLLIQSNSGGGKSWAIRRLLEQSHKKIQQLVLDPEGEFSTLREKYDYVIVGKDGDTPAHPSTAKVLALKLLELQVSTICDLYELKARDRIQFVKIFLESLISAPKRLWHPVLVVIDEAQVFCPQATRKEVESASAVIDLATRGRKRGLCSVFATQRLSKLHKDACAELGNKLIGRTSLDIDQARAADEIGLRTKEERRQLRELKPGQFYAYGPALRNGTGKVVNGVIQLKVGSVVSKHPKVGAKYAGSPPAPSNKVKTILSDLADLPEVAEKEVKDIMALRKENADLKRQLRKSSAAISTQAEQDYKSEINCLKKSLINRNKMINAIGSAFSNMMNNLECIVSKFESFTGGAEKVNTLLKEIKTDECKTVVHERPQPVKKENYRLPPICKRQDLEAVFSDNKITRPQSSIINSIAAFESVGLEKVHKSVVAAFSRVSPKSGGYFNNLGRLRSLGYIDYPSSSYVSLTDTGRKHAVPQNEINSISDLHNAWLNVISTPQANILAALIELYPEDISKNDLAERIGVSERSGGYFNNLGRLRTLGVINYPAPGRVVATDLLFPEGL